MVALERNGGNTHVKDDFLYLYHYIPWNEDTIVTTIRREYNWEIAEDTATTWRIGDSTTKTTSITPSRALPRMR
jgi:hypothetical protein